MSEDDPMDGARVGETRTLTRTVDIYPVDYEPSEWFGRDRDRQALRVGDTEVYTEEYGDEQLRVTIEADVTKQLPATFDSVETKPSQTETPSFWKHLAGEAVALAIGVGISLGTAWWVSNTVLQEVTVNGEPLVGVSLIPVVILTLFAVILVRGFAGGFPGPGVSR